jgi:hypothetical protein
MEREIKVRNVSNRRRVLQYLQSREGERLFALDVAAVLGVTESFVVQTVTKAERTHGGSKFRTAETRLAYGSTRHVWYGVTPHEEASKLEARITRWLAKPHRVVQQGKSVAIVYVPSVIAKALSEDVQAVMASLEIMYRRGDLARCELLMREGVDRFEYRLMGEAR